MGQQSSVSDLKILGVKRGGFKQDPKEQQHICLFYQWTKEKDQYPKVEEKSSILSSMSIGVEL